jgi:hypothetical protein
MKRTPSNWLAWLPWAAAVALLSSCAATRDVDVTPTARMRLDAHVGKTWNSDSTRIDNIADSFDASEPVLAVVDVTGEESGSIRAKWLMEDGTTALETSTPIVAGTRTYAFRFMPSQNGSYRLEVYANDRLEDTERFKVGT